MYKKIFIALFCCFLILSLTGCNNSEKDRGSYSVQGFDKEKHEKNIKILESEITTYGELVAIIKNNNDIDVSLNLEVNFYDKEGNPLGSDNSNIFVSNNSEMATCFTDIPKNYSDYKITFTADEPSFKDFTDKIKIKDNDTGEQLAVEITNNAKQTIEEVNIDVVYYKDSKIIGFDANGENDVKNNDSKIINIDYPYDKNFDNIPFDNYKIFVSAYNYTI